MTISYSGNFGSLLLKWKGSLWKAIWKDLLIFLFLYYILHFTYLFLLDSEQKIVFKELRRFCKESEGYIPLTFLLGFFVCSMVDRWWNQFKRISWPSKLMIQVTTLIQGDSYRLQRRTLARWANLTAAIAWRKLSIRTMKRFPTEDHLVTAGLMTFKEKEMYDNVDSTHGKWWVPLVWINNLLRKLQNEGIIDTIQLDSMMKSVDDYRCGFCALFTYNWVCIPLVYTQVVTISTYGFFLICLFGRQFVEEDGLINPHVPIFTILQFLFYMGWLKVAQDLMNPFGEDDDDFEMNHILDGNIFNSYKIVDSVHGMLPDLERDMYWDKRKISIPHTKASAMKKDTIPKGWLSNIHFTEDDMTVMTDEEVLQIEKDKEKVYNVIRTWKRRMSDTSDCESSHSSAEVSLLPNGQHEQHNGNGTAKHQNGNGTVKHHHEPVINKTTV